jgi:hypothetical protein
MIAGFILLATGTQLGGLGSVRIWIFFFHLLQEQNRSLENIFKR